MGDYRQIGAWCLLAFLLRAAYSLSLPNQLLHPDAGSFDGIAWNLVSKGQYALENPDHGNALEPTAHRPPSYPLFLAAIYKIAGHSIPAARIAQAFLGSFLVLVLFLLTQHLSPEKSTRTIAAGMAALYPFFIYYDSRLIAESFLTFSLLVYIFLFVLWKESPGNLLCAGAWGLSSAVVCLAKTTFIPLTAFCLLIETLMAFGNKANRRQYLSIIGAGLIFAAPITAWGLRNQKTLGRFLLDSHGGITFVHCTVFYDVYKQGTFSEVFKNHPIHQAAKTMGEAQCDAYYFQVARDFIRTHPHEFARQIFNKIVDFWRFYPRQDINFPEGTRTITLISLLTEPFLLCCGAYGLWKTRHQWRALYPLYTAILLLTAVHGISCAQMRYRLPLMPFAILFSAVAIS